MAQRLAISGHFRPNQMVGGIGSYFQNLVRGIDEVAQRPGPFKDLEVTVFHGAAGVPHRCDRFSYQLVESRFGRFGADTKFGLGVSAGFDAALFPVYFRPPVVRAARSVAVIHDLLYKHFPQMTSWRQRQWLAAAHRYALRHCDAVITISSAVKHDVLRSFGDRWEHKVHPIWNPVALERLDGAHTQSVTGGRPYILGVAVDRPFKNLYTLVRAFAKLRDRFPEHCLVLAGELRSRRPKGRIHSARVTAAMPSTVDLVRDLGLGEHVKITGFISDAELGALYRGADAFVLPSLFEGFGMPPIEALALGAPTIVSDIPVLREVTLGAAHYLPAPEDADSVAEVIAAVLANPSAARPSPALQAEVRQRFHPAHVAQQYLTVLLQ